MLFVRTAKPGVDGVAEFSEFIEGELGTETLNHLIHDVADGGEFGDDVVRMPVNPYGERPVEFCIQVTEITPLESLAEPLAIHASRELSRVLFDVLVALGPPLRCLLGQLRCGFRKWCAASPMIREKLREDGFGLGRVEAVLSRNRVELCLDSL